MKSEEGGEYFELPLERLREAERADAKAGKSDIR
jgi:hypothetical protein